MIEFAGLRPDRDEYQRRLVEGMDWPPSSDDQRIIDEIQRDVPVRAHLDVDLYTIRARYESFA